MSRAARTMTRLDPQRRRAQLVETAAHLFERHSPSTVTFDDVARAAGVSRSLVYTYFGDRGGLLAAVYLQTVERLDRELAEIVTAAAPDDVQLKRVVRRYLAFARDDEPAWRIIATAGELHHPAVLAARRTRIERIAAAWGSTPETSLRAAAAIAHLEAGVRHWADTRECGLDRAANVLASSLWSGFAAFRRSA